MALVNLRVWEALGGTSLALSLLAESSGDSACAYIDVNDSFDGSLRNCSFAQRRPFRLTRHRYRQLGRFEEYWRSDWELVQRIRCPTDQRRR